MENKVRELIQRYNQQMASPADLQEIERMLDRGELSLEQLEDVSEMDKHLTKMEMPSPSSKMDVRFYDMLQQERAAQRSFSWRRFFSWPELAPKLALASFMLIIGFGVGYFTRPVPAGDSENISMVKNELSELKEMMMLSLLEKESATERLRAVSLTSEMDDASSKVTSALIQTLNEDENVNVRLAALEALKPYSKQSSVREELIRAIAKQDSPLVQVALADLMAQLQAKSSVKELEKILESERTPVEVKNRIKQSIDILI